MLGGVLVPLILLNLDTSMSSLRDFEEGRKKSFRRAEGFNTVNIICNPSFLFSCGSQTSWLCLESAFNSVAFYSETYCTDTKLTFKVDFYWMLSVCMLLSERKNLIVI